VSLLFFLAGEKGIVAHNLLQTGSFSFDWHPHHTKP
jgi:hypothetical protein